MRRLRTADPGFQDAFARIVADTRDDEAQVSAEVAAILADVRRRGFAAVAELTRRFDGVDLDALDVEVSRNERAAAAAAVPPPTRAALALAAERIRAFHAALKPQDVEVVDPLGVRMGVRHRAVERAGLYVPGGRAAYPSSVLMNAIPARVAGVGELVMVTPPGRLVPEVLWAAELAGVDRIFRVGGAQAVAALAYGVAPLPRCDVIVGPGNAWVAEAKRQLYGTVGIDMVAGPSEVLVVANSTARADWVAADLLAQAEHDPTAQAILLTDDAGLADAVEAAVDRALAGLSPQSPAHASWARHGLVIELAHLGEAPALVDALAPEHLELHVAEPRAMFDAIRHAGAVFLGPWTPEALGDYLGGPNHVLPTGRRARFASGLSVTDFLKRTTFLEAGPDGLGALGPSAAVLAEAEGLTAHASSLRIRLAGGFRAGA